MSTRYSSLKIPPENEYPKTMVEIGKWILMGSILGFCLQWVLDTAQLKKLQAESDQSLEIETLRSKVFILESNQKLSSSAEVELGKAHALIAKLQSELVAASNRPVSNQVESVSDDSGSSVSAVSFNWSDIPSLPKNYIAHLEKNGISSPELLALASVDEVANAIKIQPWDAFNPSQIIDEARQLLESSTVVDTLVSPTVSMESIDDFNLITALTTLQIEFLKRSKITTFQSLASSSEQTIIEALKIMPWDMTDPHTIIAQAKELQAHA